MRDLLKFILNLKNITEALIIALVYEIFLELSHLIVPSLFNLPAVSVIRPVLSFCVSLTIILFLFLFYKEEGSNRTLGILIKIVIGCFLLLFILRLPMTQDVLWYQTARLLREIIGPIAAIFLFSISVFYRKGIPSGQRLLMQASTFVIVMFGIGIIKDLLSLTFFSRFVIFGTTTSFPPIFYHIMLILLLMTHASMIYFLYCYYKFKSNAIEKESQ